MIRGPRLAATALAVLLGATALALRSPPVGAATVVDIPASIDATGAQDVTQALNTVLAAAPDGATVRFPAGGRFRIDGVMTVAGKRDLTIDGQGSTLVAPTDGAEHPAPDYRLRGSWPRLRRHVVVADSSGITIRDLAVAGPNAGGRYVARLEGQAAFTITRTHDVLLDGVTARAVYGDGVYLVDASSGVTVRGCTFDHIGRQGVAVVDASDVRVEHCTIADVARSAIDLEPGRGQAMHVHVQDNDIRNVENFLLAAVGAGPNVGDVWIEGNRVRGGRGVSVYAGVAHSLRSGIHIVGNTGAGASAGYQGALLRFERFDGVEVTGNRQSVRSGVTPVVLLQSCHAEVHGNEFGGGAPAPAVTGDCADPGLAPVTSSTTGPADTAAQRRAAARRLAATRRRAAARRRTAATPPTTVAPVVVQHGGTSAVTIALAVGIGALAGAGGVLLVQRLRRRPPAD